MLSTLRSILNIRISSYANWFIFYLRRLPLVGKRIRESVFADLELKRIFAGIVIAFILLGMFAGKFFYIAITILAPVYLMEWTQTEQLQLFWHIFIVFSFFVVFFSSTIVMQPKRDKYICVKLMRLPATRYMKAVLALRHTLFFVTFLPAVIVFGWLLGVSIWQGMLFTVLLTGWRLVCEAGNLLIFDKTQHILVKNNAVIWLSILAGCVLAYLPPLLGVIPVTAAVLFSVPVVLLILVLSVLAFLYLDRYPRYPYAVEAVNKIDEPLLNIGRMMSEAQVKDVETREEFTDGELQTTRYDGKTGFQYLNAIFFDRHRRLLMKPLMNRLLVVAIVFIVGVVLRLLFPDPFAEYTAMLPRAIPAFLLIMAYLSIGERVCKGLFYNCDVSLMRYGYYRQSAALLQNFRIRLVRIAWLNMLIAGAVSVALMLLVIFSGGEWALSDLISYTITIVAISLFFSVHHLFMYYIFQPYTTELNMKNPFFFVINVGIYAFCGLALQLRLAPGVFSVTMLTITSIYLLLAVAMVYYVAPRTFRVK